jgi:hypothetical protein
VLRPPVKLNCGVSSRSASKIVAPHPPQSPVSRRRDSRSPPPGGGDRVGLRLAGGRNDKRGDRDEEQPGCQTANGQRSARSRSVRGTARHQNQVDTPAGLGSSPIFTRGNGCADPALCFPSSRSPKGAQGRLSDQVQAIPALFYGMHRMPPWKGTRRMPSITAARRFLEGSPWSAFCWPMITTWSGAA